MNYRLATVLLDRLETVVIDIADRLWPIDVVLASNQEAPGRCPTLSVMLDDWPTWRSRIERALSRGLPDQAGLAPGSLIFLPPVTQPRKLICLGANYKAHVKEMKGNASKYPYAFLKPPSTTLRGSGAVVPLNPAAAQNDWELELAVVMGDTARDVSEADALDYVAGYSVINDVSARDWMKDSVEPLGIDWVMQKAFDGYAPMGPFLTPAAFVPDPQALDMELTLNGVTMQKANTADMVFSVRQIIAHLSRFMTLEPGDILATGTPTGTGYGREDQIFLKPGDVVRATIAGLGTLENRFEHLDRAHDGS